MLNAFWPAAVVGVRPVADGAVGVGVGAVKGEQQPALGDKVVEPVGACQRMLPFVKDRLVLPLETPEGHTTCWPRWEHWAWAGRAGTKMIPTTAAESRTARKKHDLMAKPPFFKMMRPGRSSRCSACR